MFHDGFLMLRLLVRERERKGGEGGEKGGEEGGRKEEITYVPASWADSLVVVVQTQVTPSLSLLQKLHKLKNACSLDKFNAYHMLFDRTMMKTSPRWCAQGKGEDALPPHVEQTVVIPSFPAA